MTLSSAYLRQSILLSPLETPETRSLYNTLLKNVEGKVRVEEPWSALRVPEGINHVCMGIIMPLKKFTITRRQTFLTFDCLNPREEADKRFSYFTTQVCLVVLPLNTAIGSILTYCDAAFTQGVEIGSAKRQYRGIHPFFFRLHPGPQLP